MGGSLKTQMPITCAAYGIGTLAISGFPLLSGFYSKEEILSAAYARNPVLFALLLAFAAFLTSFYMFRSLFLTFFGSPRDKKFVPARARIAALDDDPIDGLVLDLDLRRFLLCARQQLGPVDFVGRSCRGSARGQPRGHVFFAFGIRARTGWRLLGLFWRSRPNTSAWRPGLRCPTGSSSNGINSTNFTLWFIANVYYPLAAWFSHVDYDVLDQRVIDGVGRVGTVFSWMSSLFDTGFVDRVLVDGNGDVTSWLGAQLRNQSGLAQSYLFWMVLEAWRHAGLDRS